MPEISNFTSLKKGSFYIEEVENGWTIDISVPAKATSDGEFHGKIKQIRRIASTTTNVIDDVKTWLDLSETKSFVDDQAAPDSRRLDEGGTMAASMAPPPSTPAEFFAELGKDETTDNAIIREKDANDSFSTLTSGTLAQQRRMAISWEKFHDDVDQLAKKLPSGLIGILAISRGGLVPAAILGNALGILDIRLANHASYHPELVSEGLTFTATPRLPENGKGWLIIDDLVDTGVTMKTIHNKAGRKAICAAVYRKPHGAQTITHFTQEVEQDIWLEFPWEMKIVRPAITPKPEHNPWAIPGVR